MLLRTATISITIVVLLTAALAVSLLVGGPKYFPPGALSPDQKSDTFRDRWFSQHLEALEEPVLYKAGPLGGFRFTWLRTFHHPIAIRISPLGGSSYQLTATELGGAGGYAPGQVVRRTQRTLSPAEFAQALKLLRDPKLWSSGVEPSGLDGGEWIVESTEGGYRVASQWSPTEGLVRAVGVEFLRLADLHIPPNEMY